MAEDGRSLDLMPPAFAEGLDDWSQGDGTPESSTYERVETVRLAVNDPDFGTCLELRKTDPVQRLRYMGEMPVPGDVAIEIGARLKVLRGPLPKARMAATPGGDGGRLVPDLPQFGQLCELRRHETIYTLRLLIGREPRPGIDLIWDDRVLYAHVGLDLLGPSNGVVRIESISVRLPDDRQQREGSASTR